MELLEEEKEEEALAKRVYGGNPFVGNSLLNRTAQQTTPSEAAKKKRRCLWQPQTMN